MGWDPLPKSNLMDMNTEVYEVEMLPKMTLSNQVSIISHIVSVVMCLVFSLPHPQEVVLAAKVYSKDQSERNLLCGLQVTG